jgi:hypothetical protein
MTLANAHCLGDTVVLDAAREIQPPFNPDAAPTEFSTLLKAYGVAKVIGDRYGGERVREPFRRHGIDYQLTEAPKVGHLPRRAAVVQRRPGAALRPQATGQSTVQPGAADGARRARPD